MYRNLLYRSLCAALALVAIVPSAYAQDPGSPAERIPPKLPSPALPVPPPGPPGGDGPPAPTPPSSLPTPAAKPATATVNSTTVTCTPPSARVTMDFVDAPVMDVVKYMAQIMCKNFILGEDLKGQVTIISHQQVSASEAYEAFLSALEVAGYTTVEVGKNTKVVATTDAANNPLKVYEGDDIPASDRYVTQIMQLENVSVADISSVVKDLAGSKARVIAYNPTNTLIITDSAYNIRRVYRIIMQLDVAAPKSSIEVIPLRYAAAADVEKILEDVFGVAATAGSSSSSSSSASAGAASSASARRRRGADAAPAAPAASGANATSVGSDAAYISKIISDERTNSLIVMANDEALAKIKELIGRLDIDIDPASRAQIHVVYLEHAKAEDMASVLSSLANGSSSGGGGATRPSSSSSGSSRSRSNPSPRSNPGGGGGNNFGGSGGNFGGPRPEVPGGASGDGTTSVTSALENVKIAADTNTNSLVIIASPEDFRVLKGVVDRLDIARRQVYVEAVVVEVADNQSNSLGIGAHLGSGGTNGGLGYGSAQMGASSLGLNTASLLSGLAVGVLGPAISIPFTDSSTGTSTTLSVPVFGIALKALAETDQIDILSDPSILVMDNEEATINVGRNVPFPVSSGFDVNRNPIVSYQREDVGITLKVTPQINESNYVTLEVNLQVAEVEGGDNGGLSATTAGFITSKREIENSVVVKDNQTIVLGGLIGTTKSETVTKIPVLGDIPLFGVLFRSKSVSDRRTNLLIFLTPHVISEPADLQEVYVVKEAQREEFLRRFYGQSADVQDQRLRELLKYSMNLVNEPSQYRQKPDPVPQDEDNTKTDGGDLGRPAADPAPAPAPDGGN